MKPENIIKKIFESEKLLNLCLSEPDSKFLAGFPIELHEIIKLNCRVVNPAYKKEYNTALSDLFYFKNKLKKGV